MSVIAADPEPVTERPRPRTQSVLALARVEAGRMVRHPAFLVGLAVSVASVVIRRGVEEWGGQGHYTASTGWTFVWMGTLVAAALCAGRQRIAADPDLFPATPVTAADRVMGTWLGLLGPTFAVAVAVAAAALLNARAGGFTLGDEGYTRSHSSGFFELAQPVLLVVLAGVVGIALAQLRRGRVAALLGGVMALFFGGTVIWAFQAHPVRVLHPFMFPTYEHRLPDTFSPVGLAAGDTPLLPPDEWTSFWREVRFDTAALGWHLVYVGGLILLGVWLAARLADRGEHAAHIRWLLVGGLPLLLVGGVTQLLTAGHP
jgi:hypothetical protein